MFQSSGLTVRGHRTVDESTGIVALNDVAANYVATMGAATPVIVLTLRWFAHPGGKHALGAALNPPTLGAVNRLAMPLVRCCPVI